MSIYGNAVCPSAPINTVILVDENGNEYVGVVVDSLTVFDATENDVREGKTYACDEGVKVGKKNIPAYRTTQGEYFVYPGEPFSIPLEDFDQYDYTKFQCVFTKYNTTLENSIEASKVAINNKVYAANSTDAISEVTKNHDTKSIDFNITNSSDITYIIRYFTFKEE